jgi:hypothetical protein
MPNLKNKNILVISPQSWGKMFLSKHHYAIELAKRGNTVYFLNPPQQQGLMMGNSNVTICPSGVQANLFFIDHRLFFPYSLKFRWISLFHFLMKQHVRRMLERIEFRIDIVWSFDLGNLYPLSFFTKTPFKIFHPVDEPLNQEALNSAVGANVIFSVTKEILEKYAFVNAPKYFINHGVLDSFISSPKKYATNLPIRIGFSGNLLRNDIDRPILLKIIRENPNCTFDFWGSYNQFQSNIGGRDDKETTEFIKALKEFNYVTLHGVVSSDQLAIDIQSMDSFLICYNVLKDQSKGTNYHKVMEYLATGRVIISNNITTYEAKPELVKMIKERNNNNSLPELFTHVIGNLEHYNSYEAQQKRINFSRSNTYAKQVERINKFIESDI